MKLREILLAAAMTFGAPATAATLVAYGNVQGAGSCGFTDVMSPAVVVDSLRNSCAGSGGAPGIWAANAAYSARASFGSIGTSVGASATSIFQTGFGAGYGIATAYASAQDDVIANVNSGYLSIPVDVSGTASGTIGSVLGEWSSFGTILLETFVAVISPGNQFNPITVFSYAFQLDNQGGSTQVIGSPGVTSVLVPIVNGTASFQVVMSSRAWCSTGGSQADTCSQSADFYSSARLLAATVLDDTFTPVSGATLTSASGFNYLQGVAPHPAPVPLPAGAGLLAAGLGLLGLFRRRRKTTTGIGVKFL